MYHGIAVTLVVLEANMIETGVFETFCQELNDLHYHTRKFHEKWHNITANIPITPDQAAKLQGIWDQHEAWFEDHKDD